jgi:hypothetical protein
MLKAFGYDEDGFNVVDDEEQEDEMMRTMRTADPELAPARLGCRLVATLTVSQEELDRSAAEDNG